MIITCATELQQRECFSRWLGSPTASSFWLALDQPGLALTGQIWLKFSSLRFGSARLSSNEPNLSQIWLALIQTRVISNGPNLAQIWLALTQTRAISNCLDSARIWLGFGSDLIDVNEC